jgi:hypothetical protein
MHVWHHHRETQRCHVALDRRRARPDTFVVREPVQQLERRVAAKPRATSCMAHTDRADTSFGSLGQYYAHRAAHSQRFREESAID